MTIKQTGGIFGRNPTFKDVTIEGTLTFDGAVDVTTDLTIDGVLTANGLVVDTNTLYVDATNNRTGVGTVTPDTQLHVRASSGDAEHRIEAAGSGNDTILSLKNLNTGAGAEGHIRFMDGTTTAGAISYLHNAGGVSDEMVFYTATSEAARFKSSGNLAFPSGQGIDFSATAGTGTSELFSDYEEGVWTVNYAPTTGAFTTITTVGTGRYTKVGRLVTLFASIRTSGALDVTGASGNLKITGLPFACNATIAGGGQDLNHQGWNLGTDIVNTRMSVAPGASEILMFKNTMNGSSFPSGNITVADMSTAGGSFANLISFTASYEV